MESEAASVSSKCGARLPRPRRWFAIATAALAALLLLILLFPLPRPVVGWMMRGSSGWLLSSYESGSLPVRAGRKLAGLTLQQSIADHLYDASNVREDLPDAQRVASHLAALKPLLISQNELYHEPINSPVIVSGLGWCDQVNGFAALVLSHGFKQAELVGIVGEVPGGGHSVGRIWSDEHRDWLYFDIWPDEVVVFRSRPSRPAEYLARMRPIQHRNLSPQTTAPLSKIYGRAHAGFVHNQLQPTLGGYLAARLGNWVRHGRTAPATTPVSAGSDKLSLLRPTAWSGSHKTTAHQAYTRARFEHLLGDPTQARRAYGQVLRAERSSPSTFGLAAKVFLGRMSGRPLSAA